MKRDFIRPGHGEVTLRGETTTNETAAITAEKS
jgi:hypothetical protein